MIASTFQENVILVNYLDQEIGQEEKIAAHLQGKLHRAFSIFIFNEEGELLIQQRDSGKYHSPQLWANTCCGHPRPGETIDAAAKRRLNEEFGFECELSKMLNLHYSLKISSSMREEEYIHMFLGFYPKEGRVAPHPQEIMEYGWKDLRSLQKEAKVNPSKYARWFRLYLLKYLESIEEKHQLFKVSNNLS